MILRGGSSSAIIRLVSNSTLGYRTLQEVLDEYLNGQETA